MTPPKAKNIFSGVKLSEQTAVSQPGVEQRLFGGSRPEPPAEPPAPAATPPPAAAAVPPRPTLTAKASPEPPAPTGSPAVAPSMAPDGAATASPAARFEFDLSAIPHRKDSFLFTTEEFEALQDLKLEVGRALDRKITKEALVRCAVAYLIDDWRRKGSGSPVIAPLTRRSR